MPLFPAKSTYQLWSNDENMEEYRTPPPKPQRGVLRTQNPIVVPPLNNSQQNSSPLVCRFKATEKRKQLIEQFQQKLAIERIDETFTGRDGMDAMIEVIKENMAVQLTYPAAREKAVRLLDLWLQESIIRPKDQEWCHEFQDDKKVPYLFNPPEHHRVVMTPRARSKSCDRKPSRKDSIRSLFRFRSQENNAERNTLFPQDEENIENVRLFSNMTKPIRIIRNDVDLKDDALIFDAALNCLLLLVDVSLLDEIFAVKDCRTQEQNMSFLSSILRRMGIGAEKKMGSIDDIAIFVRSCVHLKRTRDHVINWFAAALKCAPSLHVEKNAAFSNHSQIHDWVRTALKAVIDNLNCITNNGKNPLIPTEFDLFLRAITEQLCSRSSEDERELQQLQHKRDRAFHYLWLMIPSKLRHHLSDVLDFLQATANTDNCFNFTDPFFVNKQAQELGANFWLVLEELRNFIVSQKEQISIIEIYLDLRKRIDLDIVPEDIKQILQGKPNIAFCHGEQESDLQKQQRVVEMVEAIKKSNCYTPQRKAELLEESRKQYPNIMNSLYPKQK